MHLGATPFSVYNTSAPEQVTYLFANAGNRVVVTERQFLPTVRAADGAIERIIRIDDTTGVNGGVVSLAELEAAPGPAPDLDAVWRAVGPDDVATIIYTSGTTGRPKGVELTHGAVLAGLGSGRRARRCPAGDRGSPCARGAARTAVRRRPAGAGPAAPRSRSGRVPGDHHRRRAHLSRRADVLPGAGHRAVRGLGDVGDGRRRRDQRSWRHPARSRRPPDGGARAARGRRWRAAAAASRV
jgi:non-ribosomal peptide synthetase component F